MFKIHTRLAKPISYGNKRDLKSIEYIVIHYTGNKADAAKNNADYFATGNTRQAGAHFFVDKKGEIWKSVNMNRIAYAVGGFFGNSGGAGKYFDICNNANSISIELCDCITDTNWKQKLATRQLVQYIQKKCPNAKTIIRHWDVNGKSCPSPMTGINNEKWVLFHRFITGGHKFKARVTKKAALHSSAKAGINNKTGTVAKGQIVNITKLKGNFGRCKEKTPDDKYQWISLSKVEEI